MSEIFFSVASPGCLLPDSQPLPPYIQDLWGEAPSPMKITINLGVIPFAPHWVGLFVALVHNDNGGMIH